MSTSQSSSSTPSASPIYARARFCRLTGLIGLSLPNFWVATLGLLITSLVFHWIPPVTWIPFWVDPAGNLVQIALPAFALSLQTLAIVMRMTRASLLESLHEDFVRTARAKGLGPNPVIFGHALRNGLIPVVTVVGTQVGRLMGGAVIIEVIFGLPGIGYSLVQAIYNRDYPIVQVAAVYLAAVFGHCGIDVAAVRLWPDEGLRLWNRVAHLFGACRARFGRCAGAIRPSRAPSAAAQRRAYGTQPASRSTSISISQSCWLSR